MNTVKKETLNVMYQEGEICLGEADGRTYLFDGERSFLLTGLSKAIEVYCKK